MRDYLEEIEKFSKKKCRICRTGGLKCQEKCTHTESVNMEENMCLTIIVGQEIIQRQLQLEDGNEI